MRKKPKPPFSLRWIWWIAALLLLSSFIAGDTGFYTQIKLWRQGRNLARQIELESRKKTWLEQEVESLSHDLARIELEARKKGMSKKDEVVILIR